MPEHPAVLEGPSRSTTTWVETDLEVAAGGACTIFAALPSPNPTCPSRNRGMPGKWDCPAPLCFQEKHVGSDWEGSGNSMGSGCRPFHCPFKGASLARGAAVCFAHPERSGWAAAALYTPHLQQPFTLEQLGVGTSGQVQTTLPPHPSDAREFWPGHKTH